MKINKIIYIIIVILSFSSCSKWLTIDPSDQVSEKELYSTADGFYNQLNGVYKNMATEELWGRELSYGLIDVIAQYYNFENAGIEHSTWEHASKYDYKMMRLPNMIELIWEKTYNMIANINSIIKHTEAVGPEMFPLGGESDRNALLGESYALRGFLHFEMLRLFAPAPIMGKTGKYIPYVKEFPNHIPIKDTNEEILKNIIADLELGHEYTKKLDPLFPERVSEVDQRLQLQGSPKDRFLEYRGYRLHYWAIKAVLARVYHYMGDTENAMKYSKELIDLHVDEDWFEFTSEYQISSTSRLNLKMYDDVIFALYNNKVTDYEEDYFGDSRYLSLYDYNGIFRDGTDKEGVYEDYRAEYQWTDNGDGDFLPRKILKIESTAHHTDYCNKMIPMIRLSEMMYIYMESIYDSNPTEAVKLLNDLRYKRGIRKDVLEATNSKITFVDMVLNDFRREMYGEGQLFFFYKRLNLKIHTKGVETVTLDGEKYWFPLPDSENI